MKSGKYLMLSWFASILIMVSIVDASAAATNFYQGTSESSFAMSGRATLFQASDNVYLTAVGALVNPSSAPFNLLFCLYNSNANGDIIGNSIFNKTQTFTTDNGMADYDVLVSATLIKNNYYVIAAYSNSVVMKRFNESSQSLPFDTTDLLFSVIDGASWNLDPLVTPTWSNTILPAFSVDATPVPIPAAIWLLGSGLIGLMGIRRRFNK